MYENIFQRYTRSLALNFGKNHKTLKTVPATSDDKRRLTLTVVVNVTF